MPKLYLIVFTNDLDTWLRQNQNKIQNIVSSKFSREILECKMFDTVDWDEEVKLETFSLHLNTVFHDFLSYRFPRKPRRKMAV